MIRKEAVSLGEEGWQLATVLPTHQVRMNYDGSDHKKHIFFFQRQYSIKYSGNSCSESSVCFLNNFVIKTVVLFFNYLRGCKVWNPGKTWNFEQQSLKKVEKPIILNNFYML